MSASNLLLNNNHTIEVTLKNLRVLHAETMLFGSNRDRIMGISDGHLQYLLSILRKERITSLNATSDEWQHFIRVLDFHGILPYVYKQITQTSTYYYPPEMIIDKMKIAYLNAVAESIMIDNLLKDVISAFDKACIDVLVLKGPAFAWSFYPSPVLRPGVDIDLLILPEDIPRSITVLTALGYKNTETIPNIVEEKRFNQICFERNNNVNTNRKAPYIEVHWNTQPFSMINEQAELKPLFDRAITVKTGDFSFKGMHPADALCFAASHMIYQHNRGIGLKWVLDIALICESMKKSQDWELLQKLSVDSLSRIALEKSINIAQAWTNLKIPLEFEDFSRWPKPQKKETYFYSYQKTRNPASGLLLILSGNWNHLLQKIIPSPAFMRKRYPSLQQWPLVILYIRHWIYLLIYK